MARRAKIVATLGPAVGSAEGIRSILEAGVNVTRFNFSHGTHEEHQGNYELVRRISDELGKHTAVLADLQGPKIRLGLVEGGPLQLETGATFKITIDDIVGNAEIASTTFKGLPGDVKPGDPILIDDGKVKLEAVSVDDRTVTTKVVVAGPISDHKGINLPGVAVSVPALTEKDEDDLRYALHMGADLVALSFVRHGSDIDRVHEIMKEEGVTLPVIAKVEKPQAVENLADIVDRFDGIMVARGDLGVEMPIEEVPLVQKRAITLARQQAKPVIVATQMLETMTYNPTPTRAEASDCANAVLDGADCLMLSGEVSVGKYPAITVATMARIIETTERNGFDRIPPLGTNPHTQGGAVTKAAAEVGEFLGVKYFCVFTESGDSVRRMTRLRTETPVLGFTPNASIQRRMSVIWGVEGILVDRVTHTDEMVHQVDDYLLKEGRAERGDKVVIVAGMPPGIPGSTNELRVHRVGDASDQLAPAYEKADSAE